MLLYILIKLLFEDPVKFLFFLLLLVIPLLISITIHEWSHGMVAYKFGDPTPKNQGRLTFNPFAHLDPMGTLMLFIVGIGWAKPVQIDLRYIPSKTKQMLVALAGPASNFLLAIFITFILYGLNKYAALNGIKIEASLLGTIIFLISLIVKINLILCIFNMLPIPPLDGSNILRWLLPEGLSNIYLRLAPFGMIILILILFTVGFGFIFNTAEVVEKYLYSGVEHLLNPLFSAG